MGPFMEYYSPKFKQFIKNLIKEKDLFTGEYDFIVPVQSKGAMLLNTLLVENELDLDNKIYYTRSFDYIPPSELQNKNLLLIDDIVFSGRTLEKEKNDLEKKGLKNIVKAAFLKHPLEENEEKKCKDLLSNTKICSKITKEAFHSYSVEMTQICMRERPTYPDHFKILISVDRPIEPEILDEIGSLVRYERSIAYNEWSLHFPRFNLDNGNELKKYDSAFKIRFRNSAINPLKWKISPVVFPSLTRKPEISELDQLEKSLFNILYKPWHDEEVKTIDLYESITLADRLTAVTNLIRFLEENNFNLHGIEFDLSNFHRYYGKEVSEEIKRVFSSFIEDRSNLGVSLEKDYGDLDIFRVPSLRIPIVQLLRETYLNDPENTGKPLKERTPIGLKVGDIARELGESIVTTSIGCESVNDSGYIVPMPNENLSRKYRACEIGVDMLNYEYY